MPAIKQKLLMSIKRWMWWEYPVLSAPLMVWRRQFISVSPVQKKSGSGRSADHEFDSASAGIMRQYCQYIYSRQPITCRMKPSTELSAARPAR